MALVKNINRILTKLIVTAKNLKRTAYHHYGKHKFPILIFIYYSIFRFNTFYLLGINLLNDLPPHNLDNYYRVVKPSLEELEKIREGKELPREFYYDRIFNIKTCYLAFKEDELAYIHWVLFKGDYNRFLILGDKVAELNYNTTLKKFRGDKLMGKMVAYICEDLKKSGFNKAVGVAHESNLPSIKATEIAGWQRMGVIRAWGPFNRKVKV